ncbi:GerAB/ArcD/ProY family transporter [Halobacillus yeomjeoni]|uniref:GerAB/ArcD/ProY family transporter n=1 Tax=Halobacillus yeomjeoni TaxID=311194 RepID=A0A931HSM5_9BACI|nr:GerAB/ArcD/ProY family transporter [Halobacillus yeomjeoni]MBH0228623.1 GerAB/ArcD/ProY family transporter [Halobacillus yeomjeoni]
MSSQHKPQNHQKQVTSAAPQDQGGQNQTNQANDKKISRRQFFFLIVQTQIGVGILALPYDLHIIAMQDGWISLLIAGVLLQIVLVALWLVAKAYPQKDFFQINLEVFTKWGGRIISLIYVMYFISVGILILLLFGRMISMWVLPNTPFWVLTLLLVVVGVYLANAGLFVIARFYTMVSGLLLILFLLMLYSMKEMNLMYILPVGGAGVGKIMSGVNEATLSFFGFFIILILYSKVEGNAKEKLKTIFYAHWFTLGFYLFAVLVSYTFFSTEEMKVVPEPLLYMLKSFEFPLVARIDLFFISIWMVSVATSYTTYVYISGLGLKDLFKSEKTAVFNITVALLSFLVAFFIGYDMNLLEKMKTLTVNAGYISTLFFPFILLALSFIVRKFKKTGGTG